MSNTYTNVCLDGYYKDWDGCHFLGNEVKYTFSNNVSIIFQIYNHCVGIQWIQDLFFDLENKKINPDVEKGTGFLEPRMNICSAEGTRCFNENQYTGTFLTIECFKLKKLTDMYEAAKHIKFTTTTHIKLGAIGSETFLSRGDHLNITRDYNMRLQDRTLLDELTEEGYHAVNFGQVYIGALRSYIIDGKPFECVDPLPELSIERAKLVDIDIGCFDL